MTKTKLQAELLSKVKLGIKPSDLKKEKISTPASSPPASPIIVPVDKKSQPKYEPESILPPPIVQEESQKVKQLQEQVNFHANTAQTHLANLQATMAQLDAAELTIKDLTRENKSLREKYSQLEKRAKITGEIKSKQIKTLPEPSEPKLYLFTCDICQQNKKSQLHLARVNGLGIDPNKQNKICDTCLRKVDIIQPKKEDFF